MTQSPTASPTPDTRTLSLEAVDKLIAAIEDGDVDALESLVHYSQTPCGGIRTYEDLPYPPCDRAPISTPVEAFPAGVCSPVWHSSPRLMLERFVERAGPLFAVIENPFSGLAHSAPASAGAYRAIFVAEPTGEPVAYVAVIERGALVALWLGCDTLPNALLPRQDPTPAVIQQGPAFVTSTPAPERTPFPAPDLAPRAAITGIDEVDRVIEAVESGDAAQVRALLSTTPVQCTHAPQIGSAVCDDGQQEATVIDAFLFTQCEGAWGQPDLDALAEEISSWDLPLFAVAAASGTREWFRFLYSIGPTDAFGGRLLYIEDGYIVGQGGSCSPPEEWAKHRHVILRGPAWPEDSAP